MIPRGLIYFSETPQAIIDSEQVERFESKKAFTKKNKKKKKARTKKYFAPPSRFNPNDYLLKDWMALGLSEKQGQSILNFIKRGIYSNDALEKIYVMPAEVFELIKDSTFYIAKIKAPILNADTLFQPSLLEINRATKDDLVKLKGIGEFYAKQIVKYRDELGGFVFIEQILEVWKMRLDTYQKLLPQILLDVSNIKKININNCSIEELKMHPYLDYYQANSLVKMRLQRDVFKELIEVMESKLVNEEDFERLRPYLSL